MFLVVQFIIAELKNNPEAHQHWKDKVKYIHKMNIAQHGCTTWLYISICNIYNNIWVNLRNIKLIKLELWLASRGQFCLTGFLSMSV